MEFLAATPFRGRVSIHHPFRGGAIWCCAIFVNLVGTRITLRLSLPRMILVRQINRFNREAETLEGYRFMEMHVLFRGSAVFSGGVDRCPEPFSRWVTSTY